MSIQAIPTEYAGITFRSGLEADWACTFDHLGWSWQYETQGISVDGTWYLPDFYLPSQRVWAEVKGPHDERMDKVQALARSLAVVDPDDPRPEDWQIAVVLRAAGRGDRADWQYAVEANIGLVIARCPACEHYAFTDLAEDWRCRLCRIPSRSYEWTDLLMPATWDDRHGLGGRDLTMQRAPRPSRKMSPA